MASNVERETAGGVARAVLDRIRPGSNTAEWALWACALLLYGGGDTVTTFAGLASEGTREVGPLAAGMTGHSGIAGLIALKVLVFGTFYIAWLRLGPRKRVAVPAALALVGAAVTAWNLLMLA